jgi:hypothetical protein
MMLASGLNAYAASRDSLLVTFGPYGKYVMHRVMRDESIVTISRRYYAPPALLAEVNGLKRGDDLSRVDSLMIPLGPFNMLTTRPRSMDTARPLYYRVTVGDNIYQITSMAGQPVEMLSVWNGPIPGDPLPGRVLLIGWLHYDPTIIQTGPASIVRSGTPAHQDDDTAEYILMPPEVTVATPKTDIPQALEQLWMEQTVDGQNVVTEKGTAGFFSINGNAVGADLYAFHNAAARGTVLRVRNINNGRTIYVKVLGPVPETKQYAGCVLGLSDRAKAALGVQETKMFCEMSYAGY